MQDLEITDVQRVSLGPDDRLAVFIDIDPDDVQSVGKLIADWLGVEPGRVACFDPETRLEIAGAAESADG